MTGTNKITSIHPAGAPRIVLAMRGRAFPCLGCAHGGAPPSAREYPHVTQSAPNRTKAAVTRAHDLARVNRDLKRLRAEIAALEDRKAKLMAKLEK